MIGLGQPEAAEQLALRHARQVFLPLLLAAVGVDRRHGERALGVARRAEGGVDALQLAHDETEGDVADAGAAVALEVGAEEAQLAEFAHHCRVEMLAAVPLLDARHELLLRVGARGVAHHALLRR